MLHSFITVKEAMAAGELGCHSATFSPAILDELANLPYEGAKKGDQAVAKPSHVYEFPNPYAGAPQEVGHAGSVGCGGLRQQVGGYKN